MRRCVLATVAAALVLVPGACSYGREKETKVRVADPGECVPVDVAAAPESASLLADVAERFNASPASRPGPQRCTFVRVQTVESGEATRRLVDGWPATEDNGPAPALWAPASSAWVALANARRAERGEPAVASGGSSFARSPLVIAMPSPMARALGWPARRVGWRDLARLARDPRGWGAYGRPEWGVFKLGKANPNVSNTALLQTIAVARLGDPSVARALESSVIHYGEAAWPFLDTWFRLDRSRTSLTYVSAVVTDERSVTAYNRGSPNGIVPTDDDLRKPRVPLVAIRPSDGALDGDHPIVPVHAPWVSEDAAAGGRAFAAFSGEPEAQAALAERGLRPGTPENDLDTPAIRSTASALGAWEGIRKRARLLVLFDVSDSMGDLSDHRDLESPTKMQLAQRALVDALGQLAPDDEVGLRIFTTDIAGGPSPYWDDVVAIGPLDRRRAALVRAVERLRPRNGSPLYQATEDAYDAMALGYDATRINGVVLITDGHNEVDEHDDRRELLAHLHEPIRIFTISYSPEADFRTLQRIAQATNARVYDANDVEAITRVLPAALSNF
jgi:Ca-activated chloride channel family protein